MSRKSDEKIGKCEDGRRNNTPPVHSRVQPGQVLNPHGRKGKPKAAPLQTRIDEFYQKEASKIVSYDGDTPVDAAERLVREEFYAALVLRDPAVRTRVLARIEEAEVRTRLEDQEFLDHVRTRKAELADKFYFARLAKQRPPDVVPHPDHVVFKNGWPVIVGPINQRDRKIWEHKKACILIAAYMHDQARKKFRREPTPEAATDLEACARHRRWLMRNVPKEWNWREDIYCRDSMLDFARETIRSFEEIDNAASTDCD